MSAAAPLVKDSDAPDEIVLQPEIEREEDDRLSAATEPDDEVDELIPGTAAAVSGRAPSEQKPTLWRPNALLQATIDALSAHLAILDEAGIVRAVNAAWKRGVNGATDSEGGIGSRYQDLCRRASGDASEAAIVARGLGSVLSGSRRQFTHVCLVGGGTRWLQIRIGAFSALGARRAVVAHEDVSDVRRIDQELRKVTGQLLDIQDTERRRIARDLHDSTAQHLVALRFGLSRVESAIEGEPDKAREALQEVRDSLAEAQREIRITSYLLHPPTLEEGGLLLAIQQLADGFSKRTDLTITVEATDVPAIDRPEVEAALFRVAQESLTNVHRHAQASKVAIRLTGKRGLVVLEIEDDGIGLVESGKWKHEVTLGVGVPGMQARVSQFGGVLDIRSAGEKGTIVRASLPLGRGRPGRPVSEEALPAPEVST